MKFRRQKSAKRIVRAPVLRRSAHASQKHSRSVGEAHDAVDRVTSASGRKAGDDHDAVESCAPGFVGHAPLSLSFIGCRSRTTAFCSLVEHMGVDLSG